MRKLNNPIILFDGICKLCNYSVQIILKYEKNHDFIFIPLQSIRAKEILKSYKQYEISDSVLLIEKGKLFQQSTAALHIAKNLRFFHLLYPLILVPKAIRDPIYNWIARNRYRWFGTFQECIMPNEKDKDRFLMS